MTATRPERLARNATVVAACVGVISRTAQYASQPSYWCDESSVLLNVAHKSVRGLVSSRLDASALTQAAPPFFLLGVKALVITLGTSELVTRAAPLGCSIAALAAFVWLCRRVLPAWGAAFAVTLFALSPPLVFQAANLKPYSGDVLAACLLLLAAFVVRPEARPCERFRLVAWLAIPLVWISYPLVLVFAGISLAFLPAMSREPRGDALRYVAWQVPVAASFGLVFWLSARVQRDPYLDLFWKKWLANRGAPSTWPGFFLGQTWELLRFIGEPLGALLALFLLLGLFGPKPSAAREVWLACVASLAAAWLAALVGAYPFGGHRLALYLSPALFVLVGMGLGAAQSRCPAWLARCALAFAAIVATAGAGRAASNLVRPDHDSDARQAIDFIRAHRQPGETVFVCGFGSYDFEWYWPDRDPAVRLHADPLAPPPDERFWYVLTFVPPWGQTDREGLLHPYGTVTDGGFSFHGRGIDVVHLRRTRQDASCEPPHDDGQACEGPAVGAG